MSQTGKMVLFIVCASVFNIALMFLFVLIFVVGAGLILGQNPNPVVLQIILFAGFIAAIVLTFLIYGWLMKKLQAKFNLEKHLPKLFRKK